jgi:ribonuclease HI
VTESSGSGGSKPGRGYNVLLTDGSMENSGRRVHTDPPGAAGIGAVLMDSNNKVVGSLSQAIGPATKDEAEYRALIEGLQLAKGFGVTRIRVYMDAEYIVDQMNERAGANNPATRGLNERARLLLSGFPDHRISWIPREWNRYADRLALEGRQPDSDLDQDLPSPSHPPSAAGKRGESKPR